MSPENFWVEYKDGRVPPGEIERGKAPLPKGFPDRLLVLNP